MNLAIALGCIERGWYVFPCRARSKEPAIPGGFKSASNEPEQILAWWQRWPDANVGIATSASGLCVVDIDYGFDSADDFASWYENGPATYAVRTGRDGFGVQMYFSGTGLRSIAWKVGRLAGDIRCDTGYVMAAGSVHPSGKLYTVLMDADCIPVPKWVRDLKPERAEVSGDAPITAGRNNALTSIAGKLRNAGLSAAALEVSLLQVNADRCQPPLEDDEVRRIAANASKWALPAVDTQVSIGTPVKAASGSGIAFVERGDWRERYMTQDAYLNVKAPEFLIEGFLVKKSIAMLAGPVAQRKSIIALNIAHALCTGNSLFGYFEVTHKPERVVYLCPEMGAASFVKRIRQIGLSEYVGRTLFLQTMSETPTALDYLEEELPGAVVIVDTITRFIEGDENKSEDMRAFAKVVFRLASAGATIVLLHHSKKGSSGSLEDGLRGSSELAAFVDSCWVTELEDPKKPYECLSKVRNVKQRDFESDPFKLQAAPGSYYLSIVGEPEPEAIIKSRAENAALATLETLVKANPKMGINKLRAAMKTAGHGKGQGWLMANRSALLGKGVATTE